MTLGVGSFTTSSLLSQKKEFLWSRLESFYDRPYRKCELSHITHHHGPLLHYLWNKFAMLVRVNAVTNVSKAPSMQVPLPHPWYFSLSIPPACILLPTGQASSWQLPVSFYSTSALAVITCLSGVSSAPLSNFKDTNTCGQSVI